MGISRWAGGSLRRKLTIVYSALFGLIILMVALAVYFSIRMNAERTVERELLASLAVFERIWQMENENMTARAEVLAADFGFREAVATEDYPTIASAVANVAARAAGLNAAVAFTDGRLIPASGEEGLLPDDMLEALYDRDRASGVVLHEGNYFHSVGVPVHAPMLVGWAIFWSPLDEARMSALEDLSPIPVQAAIVPAADWEGRPGQAYLRGGSLATAQGIERFGGEEPVNLVISYPMKAAMAPYQPMMLAILIFSLAGAALLVVSGGLVARGLTRPIGALDKAVQALAAGQREPVHVPADDEFGRLASSFNMMLGDLAAREDAIVRMSREDIETGLANRRAMNEDLAILMQASPSGHAAIAIRIRRFAAVRGAIGHVASAEAIRLLAARLTAYTGGGAVYRINTSDLALLMPAGAAFLSVGALARLAAECSGPVRVGDASVDLLVCCGLAVAREGEAPPIGLIDQAVVATDIAEQSQAPAAEFDLPAYGNPSSTLSLMSELMQAMQGEDELSLAYQPKYSLNTREISGFEALIRWNHPARGRVFPDTFIPLAEDTGHIRPLTEWVIDRAIADQKKMQAAGHFLPVSVNISGRQLNDEAFAIWAIGKVRANNADLCFEITETAVIGDPDKALRIISLLRNAGIRISIDDYGSGLSSLSYLKQIPAHELKIDKSFILPLEDGRCDQLMIQSTVDLAHALGMSVVAEGVENERVVEMLRLMGADCVQGYHIARPMALPATLDFLSEHQARKHTA
ncbi:putative bifunctional diguanylate cyclase/phosphodiesterase [Hyphomonas sp.]|uniref:putative bifunctional diguanylate cyclase/phosphodiesterase n=1 Tax=Hyphomonas sp. TaxID=87 RepID=UPI003918F8C8